MKTYLSLVLILFLLIPVSAKADASPPPASQTPGTGTVFALTPDTVLKDAHGSFYAGNFSEFSGARGFIWLAPANLSFDQFCLYLGTTNQTVSVGDAQVTIYSRGVNQTFPTGGSSVPIAASKPEDLLIAHVDDPNATSTMMHQYCFTFDAPVETAAGNTYVFSIDLHSSDASGFVLRGAGYYTFEGTYTAYTNNVTNTDLWQGYAVPFALRLQNAIRLPNASGNSNILFLPGLEGSQLYEKVDGTERKRWEPALASSHADVQALYLHADASNTHSMYTKADGVIGKLDLPLVGFDIYTSFLNILSGYTASGKINNYMVFPYDWRMSPQEIIAGTRYDTGTRSLINAVEALAASSQTGKVTIVGHSYGGVVAKELVRELSQQGKAGLVDMVVLVDAPQLGAGTTLLPLLHGDAGELTSFGGLYITKAEARQLSENMHSLFALLPSPDFFARTGSYVLDLTRAPSLQATLGIDHAWTESLMERFLTGGRSKPSAEDTDNPNVLSSTLVGAGEDLHLGLDTWTPPPGIEMVQIAGTGLDTPNGVAYTEHACTGSPCSTTLTRKPIMLSNGDGTVLTQSEVAYGFPAYLIDLAQANNASGNNWRHATIMESAPFKELFDRVLASTSPELPQFVSTKYRGTPGQRLPIFIPFSEQVTLIDPEEGAINGSSTTTATSTITVDVLPPDNSIATTIITSEGTPGNLPTAGSSTESISSSTVASDAPTTPETTASTTITQDAVVATTSATTTATTTSEALTAPTQTVQAPTGHVSSRHSGGHSGGSAIPPMTLRTLVSLLVDALSYMRANGWGAADEGSAAMRAASRPMLLTKLEVIESALAQPLADITLPQQLGQSLFNLIHGMRLYAQNA